MEPESKLEIPVKLGACPRNNWFCRNLSKEDCEGGEPFNVDSMGNLFSESAIQ